MKKILSIALLLFATTLIEASGNNNGKKPRRQKKSIVKEVAQLKNKSLESQFMQAIEKKRWPKAETLIKQQRINFNIQNQYNNLPLHICAIHQNKKSLSIASTMLEQEDLMINHLADNGQTSLHMAALRGNTPMVELLVAHDKVNPDIQCDWKRTALHDAAAQNHSAIIALLAKTRANPNLKDGNGDTPLNLAAKNGHLESIDALLKGWPKIEYQTQNDRKRTPLDTAIACNKTECATKLFVHTLDHTHKTQSFYKFYINNMQKWLQWTIERKNKQIFIALAKVLSENDKKFIDSAIENAQKNHPQTVQEFLEDTDIKQLLKKE